MPVPLSQNYNPNFNYKGKPNYGYPDKKDKIGVIIGTLLGAGMGAASGQNTADALLRGAEAGIFSYGAGLDKAQDYNTGALQQQGIADRLLYEPEEQRMKSERHEMDKEMFPVDKQYKTSITDSLLNKTTPEQQKYDRELAQNKLRKEQIELGISKNNLTKSRNELRGIGQDNGILTNTKLAMDAAKDMLKAGEISPEELNQKALELSSGYRFIESPDGSIAVSNRNPNKQVKTGIKKILPKEASDELSMLKSLTEVAEEIRTRWKPEYSGAEGIVRGKASAYVNDPEFVALNNLVESMRMEVYGYSGKAINETEAKWLETIQAHLNQPDQNFLANLKEDAKRLALIKKNRESMYKRSGYDWGDVENKQDSSVQVLPPVEKMSDEEIMAELKQLQGQK